MSTNLNITKEISPDIDPEGKTKKYFSPLQYDWLGFDLDHTIVRYKIGPLTKLIYDVCLKYLVIVKGYEEELFKSQYDPGFLIRGIILDKFHGCFLHINRERKVVAAIHGTKKVLSSEEISQIYGDKPIQFSGLTNQRYWAGTSYFEIPFLYAFAVLIDLYDSHQEKVHEHNQYKTKEEVYEKINRDIFDSIEYNFGKWDRGWYFKEIESNISKYIEKRHQIKEYFVKIQKFSKTRIMLLTNSAYDYTNLLLTYAFGPDWEAIFDFKIFSGSKPYFFVEDRPFYELDESRIVKSHPAIELKLGGNFVGGNVKILSEFFRNSLGKEPKVCYFGDELVSDVWVTKHHTSWDTIALVEELEGLEQERGLNHFMGLTPITSEALHKHHIWDSFFQYGEIHTSFWAYLIHYYSVAYIPCVSRLTHFGHDAQFKTHLSCSDEKEEEGVVPLCTFVDGGEYVVDFEPPSVEFIAESLKYKNQLRTTQTDGSPVYFNIKKS